MSHVVTATPLKISRPEVPSLRAAESEAAQCMRCPLFMRATQTVWGEGPAHARLMMVGEQPGDREDREGEPFVGPAGALLDRALAAAGIDRKAVYLTNAVKHFKWVPAERRRLHQKPNAREIRACRHWLELELALVAPEVVVALGATAAQSMMGPVFRVTESRGQVWETPWTHAFIPTVHPASLLRAPTKNRDQMFEDFVADLKVAARALQHAARHHRASA